MHPHKAYNSRIPQFVQCRRDCRGVADLHARGYRYQGPEGEKGGLLREAYSGKSIGHCQVLRDGWENRQAVVLRVQSAIRSELLGGARSCSKRWGRTRSHDQNRLAGLSPAYNRVSETIRWYLPRLPGSRYRPGHLGTRRVSRQGAKPFLTHIYVHV